MALSKGSMDQQAPDTAQLWDSREAWRKTQEGGTNAAHLAEHLVLLKTQGGHLIPLHHAGKQADICILWIGGGRQAISMWKCFVRETLLRYRSGSNSSPTPSTITFGFKDAL